ncbi:MAG: peroxiredoxin family protein [Proteobacteria bacterium]|nr:peroxiredoxin family protein [Pseudomonadota bacterium]
MRQLGELNQNLSQLQASNTTLIAISPDDQSTTEGFAKKLKVGFSLISDPKNEIASQYAADIKGAAMYWVRPDGRIQYGYTDPPNWLDRPPQSMVVELAQEEANPEARPRADEFDAPCRPHKGEWICP